MSSVCGTLTAVVVGLGNRGRVYSQWAMDRPEQFRVVAVADPRPSARAFAGSKLGVPEDAQFPDWKQLVEIGRKLAHVAIITTTDQCHKAPAEALAGLGYHLLLEKPMATTMEDCLLIDRVCRESHVTLTVCHVMRYLPVVKKIHQLISEGVIGDVMNIQHRESVGFWHFAHSFVRGNWRSETSSSFSLLAKCCHDVDLLCYWIGQKCVKVSSFGSLSHFREGQQPEGAADRCVDCGVEAQCPYSAKKIYLTTRLPEQDVSQTWPNSVVCDPEPYPDIEDYRAALTEAVRVGPYGRCVYRCDNDVCDQQVVNMEFSSGATASLTMVAFTEALCLRETRVFGSLGELHWQDGDGGQLSHYDFRTKTRRTVEDLEDPPSDSGMRGHGGADYFLMKAFMNRMLGGGGEEAVTCGADALQSHLVCFAAEEARKTGQVVDVAKFKKKYLL